MSRSSSRREPTESRIERSAAVPIENRPARSPISPAMGASRIGGLRPSQPGEADWSALTQFTSRKSRATCRIASRMPTVSTATMTPLRKGFAMKAASVARQTTAVTKPARIRNRIIRQRKIWGEESF